MRYYPVNLDIQQRRCLVVGGGAVGTRKVTTLLDCGALVTVVSPVATEQLLTLYKDRRIALKQQSYGPSDIKGMFLVIGATNDEPLNQQVYQDAKRHNILCNIADRPDVCNFILPAIVNRGDLVISISTSGKSPAFAKRLRKDLEAQFGDEYAEFLHLMGIIREKLLDDHHEPEAHKPLFEQLISRGLIDLLRTGEKEAIDSLLKETFGEAYGYDRLLSE